MDQDGPEGNRIEKSSIERFNALAAKWTYDGTSVRDNQAVIACNVVRNSATETMGIRVMAPAITSKGISSRMSAVVTPAAFISGARRFMRQSATSSATISSREPRGGSISMTEAALRVSSRTTSSIVVRSRSSPAADVLTSSAKTWLCAVPSLPMLTSVRTGWRDLPEKAALFSAVRVRLRSAISHETLRGRITAGGLDVNAFETIPEIDFNQPVGNRIVGNIVMPPAEEVRWQNYAAPTKYSSGRALKAAIPNRLLPILSTDGAQLSAKTVGVSGMPDVAELLKAISER